MINALECFYVKGGHVALDINPVPRYNTLLLRLIYSAPPHRQSHTLPDLLHIQEALPNVYSKPCVSIREAVCTVFIMGFVMTRPDANPRPTASEADTGAVILFNIDYDSLPSIYELCNI